MQRYLKGQYDQPLFMREFSAFFLIVNRADLYIKKMIHSNYPKFDPYTILNKGITNYKDSQSHRIWYDLHKKGYEIAWGGSDPEPQVWQEMIYVACNYKDKFRYTGEKGKDHCENLQSHYKSLFQSNSTL